MYSTCTRPRSGLGLNELLGRTPLRQGTNPGYPRTLASSAAINCVDANCAQKATAQVSPNWRSVTQDQRIQANTAQDDAEIDQENTFQRLHCTLRVTSVRPNA